MSSYLILSEELANCERLVTRMSNTLNYIYDLIEEAQQSLSERRPMDEDVEECREKLKAVYELAQEWVSNG